jgi:hypothetical protein
MASQPSTLTGWAKRALAKPIGYKHVPEDDNLVVGAGCVFWGYQAMISSIDHGAGSPHSTYSQMGTQMWNMRTAMHSMMILMMIPLPKKSAKPFGELQINCLGQFGITDPILSKQMSVGTSLR